MLLPVLGLSLCSVASFSAVRECKPCNGAHACCKPNTTQKCLGIGGKPTPCCPDCGAENCACPDVPTCDSSSPRGADKVVNATIIDELKGGSTEDCCAHCEINPDCQAASFFGGKCFLYNAAEPLVKSVGHRTVFITSRPHTPADVPPPVETPFDLSPFEKATTCEKHTDAMPSADAVNLSTIKNVFQPVDCCGFCDHNLDCTAVVFYGDECYLKGAYTGGLVPSQGRITMVVHRPPEAQPPVLVPADAPAEHTPSPDTPSPGGGSSKGLTEGLLFGGAGAAVLFSVLIAVGYCYRRRLYAQRGGKHAAFSLQNVQSQSLSMDRAGPAESDEGCIVIDGKTYKRAGAVGRGSHGSVTKVECMEDGKMYAMKTISCRTNRHFEAASREIGALEQLSHGQHHENLIKIFGYRSVEEEPSRRDDEDSDEDEGRRLLDDSEIVYDVPRTTMLVMELHSRGDLQTHIRLLRREHKRLEDWELVDYTMQMCSLLQFIHGQRPPYVHRDLKPENVLMSQREDGSPLLVVTDFGIAALMDETYLRTQTGTLPYVAPECWDRRYGPSVDMWALGCTLYAMVTQKVDAGEVRVMFNDCKRPGFPQFLVEEPEFQSVDEGIRELLCSLLRVRPEDRLTAEAALRVLSDLRRRMPPPDAAAADPPLAE
eukprot:TRINITY_DN1118_c0_g1_i1.p1 TRINITY_DN1118_c0_g1~~TRINITY_DN1118_c0_g1_i1.p1  ORF type:complete len:656 (+),score=99.53 TRINITY_DN1118_c0_g1_i1:91-2058(+)